jgi:hypothetical protein
MGLRATKSDPVVAAILQEISNLPPWPYTYRERPDDLLEIRASDLEAILRAHLDSDG